MEKERTGTDSGCTDEGQEAREEEDDERLEHNSSSSSQSYAGLILDCTD